MPATGIELVDDSRLLPGVLQASRVLTEPGWENGIEASLADCAEPTLKNRCVSNLEPQGLGVARFMPFTIAASATCAPMSRMDLEARARERLARTTEWALGRALATGDGTEDPNTGETNPSLADCESVGDFGDPVSMLACLEQEAANRSFGGRLFVHMNLRMAYFAAAVGVIRPDGGRWLTPTGSTIVVSSGFPAAECDGTTETAWVTGPVWVALGPVEVLLPVDWRQNATEAYAERLAILVFSPCVNLCATTCVPSCPPCNGQS